MKIPHLRPQDLREALLANKQFAAVLVILLVVLVSFPGSPARSLLDDLVRTGPATIDDAAPVVERAPALDLPAPVGPGLPAVTLAAPPVTAAAEPPAPPLVDPLTLPPAPPPEPEVVCASDALADLLDQVRNPLAELLGLAVPGASLRELARIGTGCSTADPMGAVLDLALELADFVPPTGLDQIDLPDLPAIDIPAPPAMIELLAPVAPVVREGCRSLATVALVFVVLPPAFSLPFSQSDLIQFLGPTTALCALFDEAAP